MSELDKKQFFKPNGTPLFQDDYIEHVPEALPEVDPITKQAIVYYVLPKNREKFHPDPSSRFFALSSTKTLNIGDRLLIDTVAGNSELQTVLKIENNVVFLNKKMNNPPAVGGEVYKIIGVGTHAADNRWDVSTEKGKKNFEEYERIIDRHFKEYM